MKYNSRGFAIYAELTDLYNNKITISKSSLAEQDAVRVYHYDPQHTIKDKASGDDLIPCLHLTVEQAEILKSALQEFIDDSTKDN